MKEGKEDSALTLVWATKGHQVLWPSEFLVLGPGEVGPQEEPRHTVAGQWLIWVSSLIPSLSAWLQEEGSYPSNPEPKPKYS